MEQIASHLPGLLQSEQLTDEVFAVIGRMLKNHNGFNLDIYKDKCMKRRIAIRMRATRSETAQGYCDLLAHDQAELDNLVKVLTIHVTQFFRNPPTYAKLKEEIFPYFFARAEAEGLDSLHFWSVGCASGEEPYSLALILKEHFPDAMLRFNISIVGTDVNEEIIRTARSGVYGPERLTELPEDLKGKYFLNSGGKYVLVPEVREMVTFRQGDLNCIDCYPETDLILCRNVLIYFERQEQEKIMLRFADRLRSGGMLILGKSEILVGAARKRFETLCPIERVYRTC